MARRMATSAPPRSKPSHHSRPHKSHTQEQPQIREKECGFDWTPGIVLALVGTLTWLDHTFDKSRRRSLEAHEHEKHREASPDESDDESVRSIERSPTRRRPRKERERSREGDREKERERSRVRFDPSGDGTVDEKYYEYGPKRGRSTWR
ncbi:hypothetical protein EDB80DRAFT_295394 [Ilyonectria destructans]|nr:hypothetical protein EDB80DRAFT_295394 [Ilyonectria destructans]